MRTRERKNRRKFTAEDILIKYNEENETKTIKPQINKKEITLQKILTKIRRAKQ